jgi:hypothetical protein
MKTSRGLCSAIRAAVAMIGLTMSVGCSGDASRQVVPADTVAHMRLDDVYGLYKTHIEKIKRPPTKMDQVYAWEPMYVNGYAAMNEGLVVVQWGAPLAPAGGAAPAILAYEKAAPQEGGFVLFQDGTVKHLSASEFQAAPKAGPR